MHETCSYVLEQMMESGIWCDCFTTGAIFGSLSAISLCLMGFMLFEAIGSLIDRFKSKKKPDSQA